MVGFRDSMSKNVWNFILFDSYWMKNEIMFWVKDPSLGKREKGKGKRE